MIEDNKMSGSDAFVLIIVALFCIPFSYAIHGWVLTVLWSWSLVPIGCPPLSIVQAAMLWALYSFISMDSEKSKAAVANKSLGDVLASLFCKVFLLPFFVLSMAWCVRAVMIMFFGA